MLFYYWYLYYCFPDADQISRIPQKNRLQPQILQRLRPPRTPQKLRSPHNRLLSRNRQRRLRLLNLHNHSQKRQPQRPPKPPQHPQSLQPNLHKHLLKSQLPSPRKRLPKSRPSSPRKHLPKSRPSSPLLLLALPAMPLAVTLALMKFG